MKLTVIHPQGNREIIKCLNRLRDGTTDVDWGSDVDLINTTCSETGMIHMEWIEDLSRFKCVNVLKILLTNQLWIEYSVKSLSSLNSPILRTIGIHETDGYSLHVIV